MEKDTPQSLELQRLIGDIKTRKEALDARREALILEKKRLDLEWKLLEDDCKDVKESIHHIIDSSDTISIAPECILTENILDGGKRFDAGIIQVKEIIAPIEACETDTGAEEYAAGKLVRYTDLPQKKQIKTLLHTILELTDARGKMKLRDIAKEVDVDEKVIAQWARIMDKRGMVKVSYSIRGEASVEKATYNANPQI